MSTVVYCGYLLKFRKLPYEYGKGEMVSPIEFTICDHHLGCVCFECVIRALKINMEVKGYLLYEIVDPYLAPTP